MLLSHALTVAIDGLEIARMQEFTELLKGIGALGPVLWPVAVITIVVLYRAEIRGMIGRVKKGKLWGSEFELSEDLGKLQEKAVQAIQSQPQPLKPALPLSLPSLRDPSRPIRVRPIGLSTDENAVDAELQATLKEALTPPKLALIQLSVQIEKELRILAGSLGDREVIVLPLMSALFELSKRGRIPNNVVDAAQLFSQVRNKVIHGAYATDADAISALDSGEMILETIRAVPHETHTVKTMLPIYSDKECSNERSDAQGVFLTSKHTLTGQVVTRVFPTTKNYKPEQQVAWEWNMDKVWGESWYKAPDTNKIEYGWTNSAEFVGRVLDRL